MSEFANQSKTNAVFYIMMLHYSLTYNFHISLAFDGFKGLGLGVHLAGIIARRIEADVEQLQCLVVGFVRLQQRRNQ